VVVKPQNGQLFCFDAIIGRVLFTMDVEYDFMEKEAAIRSRFMAVRDHLDELGLRMFAAGEARAAGRGGIVIVSRVTGIARSTIGRGLKDLEDPSSLTGRIRRKGAGRPTLKKSCPTLVEDLRKLAEPATMGDPMRLLLWVSKSHEKLAASLVSMGHKICASTVAKLLEQELKYRRQLNRKTREGTNHPDRDAQFEHINQQACQFQSWEQPVISVDTKKKELVGDFKNGGSDYRPAGCPDAVRTHDFIDKELGKAVPYGVYDVSANTGWVTVGIDHDTAEFAVNAIRLWWQNMGRQRYPNATTILVTADGGGSNGSRVRLWKIQLQKLADEIGISIKVCHYPPGTSKWNKIEHRLFCHISQNWRGKPLTSRLAIVELIAATTTTKGLTVKCELDTTLYEKGIKVTDDELATLNIEPDKFHPEWNYTIKPRSTQKTTNEAIINM